MIKIHYLDELQKTIHLNSDNALDLGSGKGKYSNLLSKNGWNVDSVDLDHKLKKYYRNLTNVNFFQIDLEKKSITKKFLPYHYSLILLFRFLHRPLLKNIPKLLKKNGLLFLETFMIKNNIGNLSNKNYMLKSHELLRLKMDNMKLIHFFQGKCTTRKHLIQSAIFKKL